MLMAVTKILVFPSAEIFQVKYIYKEEKHNQRK